MDFSDPLPSIRPLKIHGQYQPQLPTPAMAKPSQAPHLLLIPYPAQGHLNPLLDLAYRLADAGLTITIVVTTKNLPLLSPLLALSPNVTPLVLPFPSHPCLPAGVENAAHLSHHLLPFLRIALADLHDPILRWIRAHPLPITALISDFFLGWTNHLAADLAVPRFLFSPSAALFLSLLNRLYLDMPQSSPLITFPSLPGSPAFQWTHLPIYYQRHRAGDPVSEFVKECYLQNANSYGFIINTFAALEAPYLDHLKAELGHPRVWAVGPLSLTSMKPSAAPVGELLTWLDGMEEGSVVYVCFGSQVVLSPSQGAALAAGLERSGARFVWCVRDKSWVPDGFEKKVAGRGVVAREWVPQVAVLSHRAVGAFLTHCGWNSVMEGVAAGVVMLTWPLSGDQFAGARLVVEAGVGVVACEGGNAVPDVEELGRVVAGAVEAGREAKLRAEKMRRQALETVEEGGKSYRDLEGLVAELKGLMVKCPSPCKV